MRRVAPKLIANGEAHPLERGSPAQGTGLGVAPVKRTGSRGGREADRVDGVKAAVHVNREVSGVDTCTCIAFRFNAGAQIQSRIQKSTRDFELAAHPNPRL